MNSEEENSTESSRYHRNWTSFAGLVLMVLSFLFGFVVFIMELISGHGSPYNGFLFIACSVALITGFILIPVGMLQERRSQKAGHHAASLAEFHLDFRNPEHRYATLSFLIAGALVFVLSTVGGVKGYHSTESVEFCGQLCHEVMNPEYVRYKESSHARVACVECHIGSGAEWFVKSKISGARQIVAVHLDTFSRPIPTPIHDLRPARETCEECHWRRKFTGYKELRRSYFLSDEENSLHQLRMLIKIGGENTTFQKGSGIHYHMLIASKVEYIAKDDRRQQIGWVRTSRADGSFTEFNSEDYPLTDEQKETLEVREMDCMDCHNRPAHQYPSATASVNASLEDGAIPRTLPYIKREAVLALDTRYETPEDASTGIANTLREFYRTEYPEVYNTRKGEMKAAIGEVQRIAATTVFPEMKARWSAYPDNIGHLNSPGCFRCHNDTMLDTNGDPMTSDCTICHLVLTQGEATNQVNINIEKGLPFIHPEDGFEFDEFTLCDDCHDGGGGIY